MSRTPEDKVKAKVKETLKELGCYYAMPIGTKFGKSGVPDFLISHEGRFIGLETKAGDNYWPTALQIKELQSIEDSGGKAMVVNETNVHALADEIHLHERQGYWAMARQRQMEKDAEIAAQDAEGGITIRS